MTRWTLLVLLAPVLALVPGTPAATAAAETCLGQEATVVGGTAPGDRVRGTDGDDVIVTSGASVWAGGGDDVICVLPGRTGAATTQVGAGDGDDQVRSEVSSYTEVHLGDGDDVYTGAGTRVLVDSDPRSMRDEAEYDDAVGATGDRDRVDLDDAASGAVIDINKAGMFDDEIEAGGGWISLVAASFRNDVPVDVGTGGHLQVRAPARPYVLYDGADEMTYGSQTLRWENVSEIEVLGARGLVYRGGPGPDRARIGGVGSVSSGGGNDTIWVYGLAGSARATLAGGTGDDTFRMPFEFIGANVALDLAARTVRVGSHSKVVAGGEAGWLETRGSLTMLGSAGDDVLNGSSCRTVLRGGKGRDRISAGTPILADYPCVVPARRPLLYGGDGSDRLSATAALAMNGGAGHDRILGGFRDDVIERRRRQRRHRRPHRAGHRGRRHRLRHLPQRRGAAAVRALLTQLVRPVGCSVECR